MGKGGSGGAVAQQAPIADSDVTPAIASSIAADTDNAQSQQLANRQRMRGIASTYMRGSQATAGKTKLGQ